LQAAYLLALPLNYFLELGFFLVAGVVYYRHWRESPLTPDLDLLLCCLTACSLLIVSFFRSAVHDNDLGCRGAMPIQFALLVWATAVIDQRWISFRRRSNEPVAGWRQDALRRLAAAFLVIGVLGTATDQFLARFYWGFSQDSQHALALRRAYEALRKKFPPSAIVQHNPRIRREVMEGLYADRQVVAADRETGPVFGVDFVRYSKVENDLAPVFLDCGAGSQAYAEATARRYRITAWLLKDTDPIWACANSWVWGGKPIFQNRFVRVISALGAEKGQEEAKAR
jgi:hypothetical protein